MEERKTISWSEIKTWSTCRQKWYWNYVIGIVPKKQERLPSIGSCGHEAIKAILLGEDWEQAIQIWYEQEINKRKLFDEEKEYFAEIASTTHQIVRRYLEHYQDTWTPIAVEEKFSIPIQGTHVRLIGYWDAIVKDKDGYLWLLEHKFPKSFRKEEDLELDGQIGIYQFAAFREGYPVVGTVYNQLLSKLPALPKINKDGSVSKARIYTDWQTYRDFLIEHGQNPQEYLDMKDKLKDFQFFQRNYIYRSKTEVRLFQQDILRKIWEILKTKKHIYRCESFINCNGCNYKELCVELVKGGDVYNLIEHNYEPKRSRIEVVEEEEEFKQEKESDF